MKEHDLWIENRNGMMAKNRRRIMGRVKGGTCVRILCDDIEYRQGCLSLCLQLKAVTDLLVVFKLVFNFVVAGTICMIRCKQRALFARHPAHCTLVLVIS